jgi:hypothetical protein
MKRTFFLVLAAALTFTSCTKSTLDDSQSTTASTERRGRGADDPVNPPPANLPAAVLNAFNARYPGATRVEWQAEDGNTWKAKFYLGNVRWKAFFKADGTFISESLA